MRLLKQTDAKALTMRLSISNIAWPMDIEPLIAEKLREQGFQYVDIAPGKYFSDPEQVSSEQAEAVRDLWARRGFSIHGMQSLLFGTSGYNLFSDDDGRMLARLSAICRLASALGVEALTFGSPRQRDRSAIDNDASALAIATDFFMRLGDAAGRSGVFVCLEPNPVTYNCNFMTTTAETADIVDRVSHPHIRLQLDVGALAMNSEPAQETVKRYAHLIGHVHASEPKLVTLGEGGSPHAQVANALRMYRPNSMVTIEMTGSEGLSPFESLERAVAVALSTYGNPQ